MQATYRPFAAPLDGQALAGAGEAATVSRSQQRSPVVSAEPDDWTQGGAMDSAGLHRAEQGSMKARLSYTSLVCASLIGLAPLTLLPG